MAGKKKTVASEAAGNVITMISVDARKLSQGLKRTFEGVALVFDSLGAEAGMPMMGSVAPVVTPSDEVKAEVQNTKSQTEDATVEPVAVTAESEEAKESEAETSTDEAVEENKGEETATTTEQSEPASSVTLDDITKIIVQKIKKNRSNNEKIGSILKTYGVAKVGELPTAKYEAFLTDLAAI